METLQKNLRGSFLVGYPLYQCWGNFFSSKIRTSVLLHCFFLRLALHSCLMSSNYIRFPLCLHKVDVTSSFINSKIFSLVNCLYFCIFLFSAFSVFIPLHIIIFNEFDLVSEILTNFMKTLSPKFILNRANILLSNPF